MNASNVPWNDNHNDNNNIDIYEDNNVPNFSDPD